MDIYVFLIVLAFFVTVLAIIAIAKDKDEMASKAIDALIKLLGGFFPKTTRLNSTREDQKTDTSV